MYYISPIMKTKLEELKQELADAQTRLAANPASATLQRIVKNREHDVAKLTRAAARPVPALITDVLQPGLLQEFLDLYPTNPFFTRDTAHRAGDRKPRYGGEKPLPETRAEVLEKHLDTVAAQGVAQIKYAHSDVTGSSLLLSTTKAGVEDRSRDLEVAANTYFYDPAWGVYWRQTGSWD